MGAVLREFADLGWDLNMDLDSHRSTNEQRTW